MNSVKDNGGIAAARRVVRVLVMLASAIGGTVPEAALAEQYYWHTAYLNRVRGDSPHQYCDNALAYVQERSGTPEYEIMRPVRPSYINEFRWWSCWLGVRTSWGSWTQKRYYQPSLKGESCPDGLALTSTGGCGSSPANDGDPRCSALNPVGAAVGNPVNLTTGNKFQQRTDYSSPDGLLTFSWYYNSRSGWTHSLQRAIITGVGNGVWVARPDGAKILFVMTSSGYAASGGVGLELSATDDGYELTSNTGWTESYDEHGRLLAMKHRSGKGLRVELNQYGQVSRVTSTSGRSVSFAYESTEHHAPVSSALFPDGTRAAYHYDAMGNLSWSKRTSSDAGATAEYRRYHYEDARFPSALTGITDENGDRYATWTYDDQGRAISSEHAGGAERHALTYNSDGSATVTNALGKQTTYHFETIHGVRKVVPVEGYATASCAGANKAYTYTPEGWLASKTDWQGNTTTFKYNARGLETQRVEAAGTPDERVTTTEWHPDLRLPVRVVEPGQVIEMGYDEQGRVLSRVVRPLQ